MENTFYPIVESLQLQVFKFQIVFVASLAETNLCSALCWHCETLYLLIFYFLIINHQASRCSILANEGLFSLKTFNVSESKFETQPHENLLKNKKKVWSFVVKFNPLYHPWLTLDVLRMYSDNKLDFTHYRDLHTNKEIYIKEAKISIDVIKRLPG